ncbi:MAG: multifunctional CCA tRNA nucleotidyl transferase/2'3'-cyclic phosphodiesterase/2'nucleotidase/phosphatase [Gammaproteobacteria bacterium]|nr:multifunctional CCA tRNA nucleotidyl transferase/2'3'-cyclic phosphodiesterase/2'nucleotidase/phosphatase [Gammaproteobacteria bacterium]
MKIYLVGGAIRDKLLGLKVRERDFVVVGATVDEMLRLGFKAVGKDFPVFLHPETYEEYALARTERKVAAGYHGFVFHAEPSVTLEQDLARRDLTINAMAQDEDGNLIDPFNGKNDLDRKCLKHVSAAFREDPVRILRLARFAAFLPEFTIDESTFILMQEMVKAGEVDALVPERVWQETKRALECAKPNRFFEVLKECGALSILFPSIEKRFNLAIKLLNNAVKKSKDPRVRFAALLNNLSISEIKGFAKKLNIPREYLDLALLSSTYCGFIFDENSRSAEEILCFFEKIDAFRRPKRLNDLLSVCVVFNKLPKEKIQNYKRLFEVVSNINGKDVSRTKSGVEIKNELHRLRRIAIEAKLF